MALIRCVKCQAEASDEAPACPKRGTSVEVSRKLKDIALYWCDRLISLLTVGAIIIAISGCSQGRESADSAKTPSSAEQREAQVIPADIACTIVDSHVVPGVKRSLDVRLSKRVSEDTLRLLALRLKSEDSRSYERTFICYYLPQMEVGAGAWATTHFNPGLDVQILGLTSEEEQVLTEQSIDPSREVVGCWLNEIPGLSNRITIYRQNDKLFLENAFPDGSRGTEEIIAKPSSAGKRFEERKGNQFGEFYLIDLHGDLQICDEEGIISTSKAITGP